MTYDYTYNKLNQLEDVDFQSNFAQSPLQSFHLTYLGNDDLDTISHPNGLTTPTRRAGLEDTR